MRKREKYINFATSRMCSDDKTVNVYSSMVSLVPHNECADGYVVLTRVIVHEKVHAPPPPQPRPSSRANGLLNWDLPRTPKSPSCSKTDHLL